MSQAVGLKSGDCYAREVASQRSNHSICLSGNWLGHSLWGPVATPALWLLTTFITLILRRFEMAKPVWPLFDPAS